MTWSPANLRNAKVLNSTEFSSGFFARVLNIQRDCAAVSSEYDLGTNIFICIKDKNGFQKKYPPDFLLFRNTGGSNSRAVADECHTANASGSERIICTICLILSGSREDSGSRSDSAIADRRTYSRDEYSVIYKSG